MTEEESWGESEETAWLKRKLKRRKEEKEALERAEEEEKEKEPKGSTYLYGHLAQNAPHMLETEDTTTEDLSTELKRKKLEVLEIALKEHYEEKKKKEVTKVTDTEDREEEKPRKAMTSGNFCQKHNTFYDTDLCSECYPSKQCEKCGFFFQSTNLNQTVCNSCLLEEQKIAPKKPQPTPIEIGMKTCSKCGKEFEGCIGENCVTVCDKCQLSEGEWFE